MRKRVRIDPSQPWGMRVSVPGKDVLADDGPYLFDGSLETLQVHQSGYLPDVFNWYFFSTPSVCRAIGVAGEFYPTELVIPFPALPYIPHIEWGITSDGLGGDMIFPSRHANYVTTDPMYTLQEMNVAMIPATDKLTIIGTTYLSDVYGLSHGGTARQGDLYYTVFKRPTT